MAKNLPYNYGNGLPAGAEISQFTGVLHGSVEFADSTNYGNWGWGNGSLAYLATTVGQCHAAGIPCFLQVYAGWGSTYYTGMNNIYDPNNATYRNQLFATLQAIDNSLYANHSVRVDGFEMDWECDENMGASQGSQPGSAARTAHTAFYQAMKAYFPTKLIGTTQTWRWTTMTTGAEAYLDHIWLMAYDIDGGVGPWYSSYTNIQTFLTHWASAGFTPGKLVLGISAAAYLNGSWSSSYRNMVDTYGIAHSDNATGNYTFNGYDLVMQKTQYVHDYGYGGVGTYYISFDKLGTGDSLHTGIAAILGGGTGGGGGSGPAVDIGAAATVRTEGMTGTSYTLVNIENPANAAGEITSVSIYASGANITDLTVAVFEVVSGYTLKVRSSASIGACPAGSAQTFVVSLAIQPGDLIGCYYTTAASWVRYDGTGGQGILYFDGECKDVNDQQTFTLFPDSTLSLWGEGAGSTGVTYTLSVGIMG